MPTVGSVLVVRGEGERKGVGNASVSDST